MAFSVSFEATRAVLVIYYSFLPQVYIGAYLCFHVFSNVFPCFSFLDPCGTSEVFLFFFPTTTPHERAPVDAGANQQASDVHLQIVDMAVSMRKPWQLAGVASGKIRHF